MPRKPKRCPVLTFLIRRWVEAPEFGNGGDDWVERHISDWVNVAGTMLVSDEPAFCLCPL